MTEFVGAPVDFAPSGKTSLWLHTSSGLNSKPNLALELIHTSHTEGISIYKLCYSVVLDLGYR